MSLRVASWLSWSLAGLSVAMFASGVVLVLLSSSGEAARLAGDLLIFVPFLAFPVVGALIASRRPENPIGWICLVAGLFWMFIGLGEGLNAYGLAAGPGPAPSSVTLDALTQWIWVPPVGLLGIYMILLFPDGKLPSRRWRPLAWFSGAMMVSICILMTIAPGPLVDHEEVRNPFGLEGYPWLVDAAIVTVLLLPLCILASALSLILRFRRSGGEARRQIKWLAFAASLVGLLYFGDLVGELVFAPESIVGEAAPPIWVDILRSMIMLSYAGIPVAVGFAILRHRLYDIDVIINRTLVYGSLTMTLAAAYFGGVAMTQTVFRLLTGQEQQPQLAVVASTLVIAALFNPLRRRIRSFIDRRFYRGKYDAAKTLEVFSSRLRDETDLSALKDDLVRVVGETVQPAHVSLWLRSSSDVGRGGVPPG